MKTRQVAFAFIAIALFALAGGCDSNEVGRLCFTGDPGEVDPEVTQAVVASPALECQSRTCLAVPDIGMSEPQPLCTAECESDSDCDAVPETPCETGFTCAIPVVVGPFCCQKLCVCRDYIVVPEDGVPVPAACDPDNSNNTCRNLPGRS